MFDIETAGEYKNFSEFKIHILGATLALSGSIDPIQLFMKIY